MFSSFTTLLTAAEDQLKKLVPAEEIEEGDGRGGGGGEGGDVGSDESGWGSGLIPLGHVAQPPWVTPPPHLRAHSAEWAALVRGALLNENTFIIAPARLLAVESVVERLRALGISDVCAALTPQAPPAAFVAGILSDPDVQTLRFNIVPRFVLERHFWENASWRVEVLRQCASVELALDTLEVLNTEPGAKPGAAADSAQEQPRRRNIGVWDNGAALAAVRAAVAAEAERAAWAASQAAAVTEALTAAGGSAQLLQSLTDKGEVSELGDSVLESCRYHKAKIGTLLGDLETAPVARVAGTPLDPEHGPLHGQLLEANTQLQKTIAAYTAAAAAARSSPAATASAQSSPATATATAAAAAAGSSIPSPTGSPQRAPTGVGAVDDAAFEAELPWDDDDDDDDDGDGDGGDYGSGTEAPSK